MVDRHFDAAEKITANREPGLVAGVARSTAMSTAAWEAGQVAREERKARRRVVAQKLKDAAKSG